MAHKMQKCLELLCDFMRFDFKDYATYVVCGFGVCAVYALRFWGLVLVPSYIKPQ